MAHVASQEFTVYKGDTFVANAIYRSADGIPVDLTTAGITIDAWIKTRDNRELDIPVTITNATSGAYTIEGPTSDWPLGRNRLIIRYTQGATVRTAEPVVVNVEDV